MSDYQPKVGDKVMVGESGPYEVHGPHQAMWSQEPCSRILLDDNLLTWVPNAWLTPAPEPEPDEPTAPGALVRDGDGDLVALGDDLTDEQAWVVLTGDMCGQVAAWSALPRPITVVLADPAEVEALREERDQWESDYQEAMRQVKGLREDVKHAEARADELQRRITRVLSYIAENSWAAAPSVSRILRGES